MDGEVMSCRCGRGPNQFGEYEAERMIKREVERAIQAERARLRAVLLSVAQQCGGPVQFAVRKIAEEM